MKSLSVSIISAISVVGVTANSNFGGNGPSSSPYFYSEINSLNFDNDGQQDSYNAADDFSDSASVVASSLLYEGGCLVSSQAMMCNGGESIINTYEFDSEEDYQDSDEEDDDEDDGHSSMLSNASVRHPKALADGSSVSHPSQSSKSSSPSTSTTSYSDGKIRCNKKQSASTSAALLVRGGGVGASVFNNDLTKKLFVAALVTLVFEALIGHICEFLKIVMQTSPAGTTYTQVYNDITSQKGIAGLWDGFAPWGVIQSILKGGVFGLAHATAVKTLVPITDKGTIPMGLAMVLAGGIGGGFQGYVLSPTLLMKTRVMTNPVFREQMSAMRTTWLSLMIGFDVVKTEGFMTLMKGANLFAAKRMFDWASRYFYADLFEALFSNMKGSSLTTMEKSISSLLGGVASTFTTLPLDVLVAKTQDAKKAGVKVSALKMFKDELDEVGLGGLRDAYLRGIEARLLHVCLTTVVMKTGAPIVYDLIFGKSS